MQLMNSICNFHAMLRQLTNILFISTTLFGSLTKKVIKDDLSQFIIRIEIEAETEADLRPTSLLVGLPNNQIPNASIQLLNKAKIPFYTKQEIGDDLEWINQQSLRNLETGTLHISPLINHSEYYRTIIVTLNFDKFPNASGSPTISDISLLENRIVNWTTAKNWIQPKTRSRQKVTTFPEGQWIQFFLTEDGITSISYASLAEVLPNISSVDPRTFSIYMSQELGRPRSQLTNQIMAENLVEIRIRVDGENDGSFDEGDKIIFYGQGPSGFGLSGEELIWKQNIYFTNNSCWLFIPEDSAERGTRVEMSTQPASVDLTLDYGFSSHHHELDLVNLKGGGTVWLSSPIASNATQSVLTMLPDPKDGVESKIKARLYGHSLSESVKAYYEMAIYFGSNTGQLIADTISWSYESKRDFIDNSADITLNNGSNVFYIRNHSNDANSSPYLDYFEIHYGRELIFSNVINFRSPISGQNIRFTFDGEKSDSETLWEITDPKSPENVDFNETNSVDVTVPPNNASRYILFDSDDLSTVEELILKENQEFFTLRQESLQKNYIIIGPESFREESEELRLLRSPAIYASLEAIYDEFSGGNKDPMGIRSFIQWTQEYWTQPTPFCLMIMGDAGFDYRNITGQSSIIVPTIQIHSYATDDRLANLYGQIPEIAIGRFPAKNESEVLTFVEKVIALETKPDFGPWRQSVTLLADDPARPEPKNGSVEGVGKTHTTNSEILAGIVPQSVRIQKIYLLEYPEVSDASNYGVIKPDATADLFKAINKGTAIISYIGHGSPYQLAQENLLFLGRGDINQMNTGLKMPLWIVGTCSFGHFDDPLTESFSEELIRDPLNAASMVISTSRPISVNGNSRYTREIFESIFEDGLVTNSSVGAVLQIVKDGANEGQYFHLFGDPAMKIPMPKNSVNISQISPDTLKTLSVATFTGDQSALPDGGNGYVTIMDAHRNVTREFQVESIDYSLSYNLPGATLFRGQFSFTDDSFSSEVRIPHDISYSNDPARLIVYIHNDTQDAMGVYEGIQLKGGDGTNDTFGPQITFETSSGRLLEAGDHFSKNEKIVIRFSDPLGINLTDEPGHEILVTDVSTENFEIITHGFYYDQNSIVTGTIPYPTLNGEPVHIRVKAWDNANNPTEKVIELFRSEDNVLGIYNAYNFPNPFSSLTQFAFEITKTAYVKLDIYTLGGRRIKSFDSSIMSPGYHTLDWDGLDAYGRTIANGVYLYRIKAKGDGTTESYIGRCAKIN